MKSKRKRTAACRDDWAKADRNRAAVRREGWERAGRKRATHRTEAGQERTHPRARRGTAHRSPVPARVSVHTPFLLPVMFSAGVAGRQKAARPEGTPSADSRCVSYRYLLCRAGARFGSRPLDSLQNGERPSFANLPGMRRRTPGSQPRQIAHQPVKYTLSRILVLAMLICISQRVGCDIYVAAR